MGARQNNQLQEYEVVEEKKCLVEFFPSGEHRAPRAIESRLGRNGERETEERGCGNNNNLSPSLALSLSSSSSSSSSF